mmetsp:Transcript_17873/g.36979  ORF Transcript_17873/g.36979 Transcript_17873/m.36979 type:complete len:153 (-) Transcript_17873:417-875(-)
MEYKSPLSVPTKTGQRGCHIGWTEFDTSKTTTQTRSTIATRKAWLGLPFQAQRTEGVSSQSWFHHCDHINRIHVCLGLVAADTGRLPCTLELAIFGVCLQVPIRVQLKRPLAGRYGTGRARRHFPRFPCHRIACAKASNGQQEECSKNHPNS